MKMLLVVYVVLLSATFTWCQIFPESLVFEGLGLPDLVNSSDAGGENRTDTVTVTGGDLKNALVTMNFHRYD